MDFFGFWKPLIPLDFLYFLFENFSASNPLDPRHLADIALLLTELHHALYVRPESPRALHWFRTAFKIVFLFCVYTLRQKELVTLTCRQWWNHVACHPHTLATPGSHQTVWSNLYVFQQVTFRVGFSNKKTLVQVTSEKWSLIPFKLDFCVEDIGLCYQVAWTNPALFACALGCTTHESSWHSSFESFPWCGSPWKRRCPACQAWLVWETQSTYIT